MAGTDEVCTLREIKSWFIWFLLFFCFLGGGFGRVRTHEVRSGGGEGKKTKGGSLIFTCGEKGPGRGGGGISLFNAKRQGKDKRKKKGGKDARWYFKLLFLCKHVLLKRIK